jgi:hypothetical protein
MGDFSSITPIYSVRFQRHLRRQPGHAGGRSAVSPDMQSDKFSLEKSVKEAPGRCFVRKTRDFVAEIAHVRLSDARSLRKGLRRGSHRHRTTCEIELHGHKTGL